MVSAAVLMGVSPVLGMSANSASVQAAPVAHAKGVNNTYGNNSRVKLTKTMKFVDRYGKKTSKTASKGGNYTIWNVKTINGQVYYSIQTDLKYWIPASATEGTVTYKSGNKTYTLKSNGKKVTTTVSSNAKKSSKTSKSTVKSPKSSKNTESTSKKSTKSNDSKSTSSKSTAKKETSSKTTEKSAAKSASKKTTSTKKTTASKSANKVASEKTTSSKSTSKKSAAIKPVKITMKNRAYVYDQNGKRVKNYLNTKYVGKGVTVNGLGTKTIKGVKYYALQPNRYYVKASDVTVK